MFCMIIGKCYKNYDTCFFLLFFSFAYVSTIKKLGVSFAFFKSMFLLVWILLLAIYYSVQISSDTILMMTASFIFSAFALGLLCMVVLVSASKSLMDEIQGNDILLGCFENGRLCALKNANIFGIYCICLIMISSFLVFQIYGKMRCIFFFRDMYSCAQKMSKICIRDSK